jgi:wobble nucleotide-excising tRNase
MGKSLREIAQQLKDANKKVQLIYAFNGTGKTRLSREFKELISPKDTDAEDENALGVKILYYNAFTEDLFYWDNDLDADIDRKLKIQPNNFTDWVLRVQGQEPNIVANFQYYTSDKLTPLFSEDFSEVRFSFERGNDEQPENVKISKGEESCFIWSVFYSFLEQIINVLNVAEIEERETDQFNDLKYVFIDDPVSSLDDNHLIELAVNVAELIKSSRSELKFIVATHNPLFYNVLFNEFNNADSRYGYKVKHSKKRRLEKLDDGTFLLEDSKDSPFSYHLFLLSELEKAMVSGNIQKYHFNFLRNILEKTSTFLGYTNWEELLPTEARSAYYRRILNLSSHSKHHGEESSIIKENDKKVLRYLVNDLIIPTYHFRSSINNNETEENATV